MKIWNTAFPADSKARTAIRPWISENQNGQVFCAPTDSLDLGSRMTAFDFTNILNDERKDNLGPAVISYIMHRTKDVSVNKGNPALYFVDETAPLLRNDLDRKSDVSGKRVSVRVERGGHSTIKKKNK